MHLLGWALGIPEELSLRDVVSTLLRLKSSLNAGHLFWVVDISTLRRLGRGSRLPTVWPVVGFALSYCMTLLTVPVLVHDRTDGAIDGKLLPIDAESRELSIEVGKVPSL